MDVCPSGYNKDANSMTCVKAATATLAASTTSRKRKMLRNKQNS